MYIKWTVHYSNFHDYLTLQGGGGIMNGEVTFLYNIVIKKKNCFYYV